MNREVELVYHLEVVDHLQSPRIREDVVSPRWLARIRCKACVLVGDVAPEMCQCAKIAPVVVPEQVRQWLEVIYIAVEITYDDAGSFGL